MASSLDSFIISEKHRHKTAMDFVVESLRTGILSGAIAEGTPLRQEELASKFGLSRMPIRDAIRQLEAEGLVSYEAHKGASVAIMTIEDIVEIYDMRIMAECAALDFGFSDITGDDVEKMSEVLSEMDNTTDAYQLSVLNEQFHDLLYSKAQRPRLLALIKTLHDSVDRHLRFLLTNLDYTNKSQQDHKNILSACSRGDSEAAKKCLASHLAEGRDSIVTFLEKRRQPDLS